MTQWFFRKQDVLVPADDRAQRLVRRLFQGEAVQIEVERSRSYKWHSVSLLGDVAEMQETKHTHGRDPRVSRSERAGIEGLR